MGHSNTERLFFFIDQRGHHGQRKTWVGKNPVIPFPSLLFATQVGGTGSGREFNCVNRH